jgi:hypothetical protein
MRLRVEGEKGGTMAILESAGKLTYLRVHDVGSKWGPPQDALDVEVVFKLDRDPDKAFGFTLRDDTNRAAHQGMLDLLRDAFAHGWNVTTDYDLAAGKKNGRAIRVWLTR